MQYKSVTAAYVHLAGALLIGVLTGCAMVPPRSFLDPTAVGMFPLEYREGGIRRVLTPREGPIGLANATEPTPEDLVPIFQEYRIGELDQLGIVIEDFLHTGVPFQAALEVDPTGHIRLPQLGLIKVLGKTEREVEQELRTRLIESGLLPDPIVQVTAAVKRQQYFSVIGSVSRPGTYPLTQPDTRLLDVIGLVGDISPTAPRLYVVRRTELPPAEEVEELPEQVPVEEPEWIIPPPTEQQPGFFEGALFSGTGGGSGPRWQESRPATRQQPPEQEVEATQPTTAPALPAPQRPFAPLIFEPTTGELKEAPVEQAPPAAPPAVETPSVPPEERREFDWEAVPEYELSQRVIEIDVKALKAGDPRYNIVIRNRDLINVPVDVGVFYVMGEVLRPGVYSFGGREITIKQAIATVGGFSALAWPSRCEIIRREPGTDKQLTIPVNLDHIFAGLEDDILLRPDDIVNVGTDIIAPFLFVIRNSFRMTYGFGFVFDRNFADKYQYGARINPETLKIQRRQQRGLPF